MGFRASGLGFRVSRCRFARPLKLKGVEVCIGKLQDLLARGCLKSFQAEHLAQRFTKGAYGAVERLYWGYARDYEGNYVPEAAPELASQCSQTVVALNPKP